MSAALRTLEDLSGPLAHAAPHPASAEVPVVAPATIEEAAEALRLASLDGLQVVPVGAGSKLGWCAPSPAVDFMLSTRRLTAVVAHEPDDGTLTVQSGMPVHTLRALAREGGHFVTPDVAQPATSTLGGVLAAGQSGLDRLRFGPTRDHVLGMSVLLGDGTLARTGGRLVKNVTGFDLHKLYCGSHGSLCLIVEASLRLFPEPEHEVVATVAADDDAGVARLADSALALPARTVSLVAEREGATWRLEARLFGKPEAVEPERALFEAAWPGASFVEGPAARARAEATRDAETGSGTAGTTPLLRVTCRPTEVWKALAVVDEAFGRPPVRIQPGAAILECALPRGRADLAADCAGLRAPLARACSGGAKVRLLNATPNLFEVPTESAQAVMRRLQESLDPWSVFARGRMVGGL